MYIYIYTYVYVHIYIYIYTYHVDVYTGSALMGSLQIQCLFDRGTLWILPLTYFALWARDSEPPKRVASGWVVSWDPSFALHIKTHA